ncbi:thiamine pyrophosphate-dependent acetolactate synthase large subunit-like protein [Mumia flava]|uniref:Thiamine pyrophosphate-dependent acetolactate synthase large subunit-like protein n=1 Tax=Mumia flava TaxID=1348852 RepID=A0A0B2BP76_9ACTN|nr:thiamine pyrophosphate-binding protein [Mumia flava]PJJ57050.1 thiamine pyrophosphate-dependent acetolactate synthase large subunit-like protein [Mumia flava]
MHVAEAVGRALVDAGVTHAYGVVGSGNFHLTNAMVDAGARFVATRHEGGAATAADAYARTSGDVAVLTVHQGCGLTNAMTGITEAAKSRTPLVVVAAEATQPGSNFFVDQDALARAVGAVPLRVTNAAGAVDAAREAVARARSRRTVLLNLPLDVQGAEVPDIGGVEAAFAPDGPAPEAASDADLAVLVDALLAAERPVFVAGRGARTAGSAAALEALAARTGALLATSAVARGLFVGNPYSLDVSGGFSSPLAADLVRESDLIVGWGCALNMWTMRHGRLIGPETDVVQVDDDPTAIGAQRPGATGVVGDVCATAADASAELERRAVPVRAGRRTPEVRDRIAARVRWRDVPYDDTSSDGQIDPRTLTIGLDDVLPRERVVAVDSGNFMGYPSMFLDVPDERGFCFTQAFQSIGLGLATAIGAALAQPDRLTVAALGDGGALMGSAELETVVRLGLDMAVVVYDDEAYGAEVHHFGPHGHPLGTVEFPPTDIAAIGRGYGFEAVTVRAPADLDVVARWVTGDRERPMLVHAKVTRGASWWLEEAFAGH